MTAFQDGITQYNVIVGAANKALASVTPSATSGVPIVSQGATSNPTFGTVLPAGGGTGLPSLTAYGLIAAGTTSTGNFQQISTGTSGQILRAGGAGALAGWSTATYPATAGTSGNVLTSDGTNFVSSAATTGNTWSIPFVGLIAAPVDSTTYYYGQVSLATPSTSYAYTVAFCIPKTGTVKTATLSYRTDGTLGSNEDSTFYIRLNDTTNTSIGTVKFNSASVQTITNTSLNISVNAGDNIILICTTPAWATNPTNTRIICTITGI